MQYTTLGTTGLKVSVAGLGTGGFSRLGLKPGKTEEEAARLIHEAIGLGINFIDTAQSYGTEGVVGRALKTIPREQVVIATKAQFRGKPFAPPETVVAALDNSLQLMGTDYVDVFNLHGVELPEYDYALNVIAPALLEEKRKGKIRHIGITKNPNTDFPNELDPAISCASGSCTRDFCMSNANRSFDRIPRALIVKQLLARANELQPLTCSTPFQSGCCPPSSPSLSTRRPMHLLLGLSVTTRLHDLVG